MKENQELKEDNIVNDDKLEKEVTEEQEKWCLYRRVEVISADDEVNTRIDPYDKAKLIKNLFYYFNIHIKFFTIYIYFCVICRSIIKFYFYS